ASRDLHSFPTRRSSDLIHLVTSQLRRRHTGDVIPIQTENAPLIFLELRRLRPSHIVAPWEPDNHLVPFDLSSFEDGLNLQNGFRSEEHTSELQSPCKLV